MFNKKLMALVSGWQKPVALNVLAQWLALCCNILIITRTATLLSILLTGALSAQMLTKSIILIAVCIAIRFVLSFATARLSLQASEGVKLSLREQIYRKLLALGPAYNQSVGTAEAVQVAVEGIDQLEIYFGRYIPQLFYSLLAPLTLFIVIWNIRIPLALTLLLCVPLIPLSIVAVQKFAKKLLAKYWGKYTSLGDGFLENLQGLTTLKIYGSDEEKHREMNVRAEEFRHVTMRVLIMQLNSISIMDLIAYGGTALGIAFAVISCRNGNITLAQCIIVLLLAADFFLPLRQLGSFFHVAMNGMAAGDKILKILALPTEQFAQPQTADFNAEIHFNNVVFQYDESREILHSVSLQAKPGITALVGESGSGKSTIAALLTKQYTEYSGEISIGGTSLSAIDFTQLAENVTLVSHNAYLFRGTVRENLQMAAPAATDDMLWQVLEQVNLAGFLHNENGLDTALQEQGGNFSGGQRQRLALARAILHNTPVYVFDEATSNIDAESENEIARIIWELGKTKTVLLISHRLANVVPADNIYVLQAGAIVEQGTHKKLLAENGIYAQLYTQQSRLEAAAGREAANA